MVSASTASAASSASSGSGSSSAGGEGGSEAGSESESEGSTKPLAKPKAKAKPKKKTKTVEIDGTMVKVQLPVTATDEEIKCEREEIKKCHQNHAPRCKATLKNEHCCRHWWQYLGFCYA